MGKKTERDPSAEDVSWVAEAEIDGLASQLASVDGWPWQKAVAYAFMYEMVGASTDRYQNSVAASAAQWFVSEVEEFRARTGCPWRDAVKVTLREKMLDEFKGRPRRRPIPRSFDQLLQGLRRDFDQWLEGLPPPTTPAEAVTHGRSVDPNQLPYPLPPGVSPAATSKRSERVELVQFPDAIAAGTAQCPEMYTKRRGASVSSSEGPLVFYQNRLVFYADSGETMRCEYTLLQRFSVRRGLILQKLTLYGSDGSRMRFKIGPEMAANADYILEAKGIARVT